MWCVTKAGRRLPGWSLEPMSQTSRRAFIGGALTSSPSFHQTPHPRITITTTVKMADDSSDLSSLPSEDETDLQLSKKDGILKFFSKAPRSAPQAKVEASPPRPKRELSPPHEYVLADNPDLAVSSCICQPYFFRLTRGKRVLLLPEWL